jgi:hypothetical protein
MSTLGPCVLLAYHLVSPVTYIYHSLRAALVLWWHMHGFIGDLRPGKSWGWRVHRDLDCRARVGRVRGRNSPNYEEKKEIPLQPEMSIYALRRPCPRWHEIDARSKMLGLGRVNGIERTKEELSIGISIKGGCRVRASVGTTLGKQEGKERPRSSSSIRPQERGNQRLSREKRNGAGRQRGMTSLCT